MSKEERDNILDQHKEPYNGNIMQSQTSSNEQPLYVQDFANDKQGINIDIHGNVKPYTNFNINESHSGLDMIGDGDVDLKNGTVDFEDVTSGEDEYDFGFDYPETDSYENNVMVGDGNEDEIYISLGEMNDMIGGGEDDLEHGTFGFEKDDDEDFKFEKDDDDFEEVFHSKKITPNFDEFFEFDEIADENPLDDEELSTIKESVEKSLDMFRRFKKY
jgi:hypothetical protein